MNNNRFIINSNFDNCGFEEITPKVIIDVTTKYEIAQNRLYKADDLNEKELGFRCSKIDKRSINVSDRINHLLAAKIGYKFRWDYPDSKARCFLSNLL